MIRKLLIICVFAGSFSALAQTNDATLERRWLILLTQEEEHPQLQEQMGAIEANREAAKERKIAVMQMTIRGPKPLFNSPVKTLRIAETFNNTRSKDTDFEAILVGLDGTVKLRRKRAIEIEELFDLIDSMPMRQEEVQRQIRAERVEKEREEERMKNR